MEKNIKGITFCGIVAIPAWVMGGWVPVIGSPVFAIIFGMIIAIFIKERGSLEGGLKFTSKKVLQFAVIFLGFGMNLSQVVKMGKESLPIILTTITIALVVSFVIAKLMKMEGNVAILIGVGSSICGGSAIAATAPVIKAKDEEIAQAISVIFMFNVVAALMFPTLGGMLGFSNEGFGLFAGTAINDTSSVTAAATSWDGIHGSDILDTATIVKLTRTLAIIPITMVLSFWKARENGDDKGGFSFKKSFPTFIIFFLLAVVITSVFNLGSEITQPLKEVSKFFITMAMVAIGMNTGIGELIRSGKKPIFLGFCCWIAIASGSIIMQKIMGMF